MRARELPDLPPVEGEIEFFLPANRALHASLGGTVPPELEPYVEHARKYTTDVERLTPRDVGAEITRTRDAIKTLLLEAKRRQLRALLSDGAPEAEIAPLLVQTAREFPREQESVSTW